MKRKLFSLALAVLMLLSMVPVTAFAAGTDVEVDLDELYRMQFVVGDATADVDSGTVKVNVSVERNGGFAGLLGQLVYDDTLFTLEEQPQLSTSYDFSLIGGPLDEGSPHTVMLSSEKNLLGDGIVLTYTFRINPDAEAGTYAVEFKTSGTTSNGIALEVLDEKLSQIRHSTKKGNIIIPGYTVTYDANGGVNAPAEGLKTMGKDFTISSVVPSRSGYNFLGWAVNALATEAQYKSGDVYSEDADVTLYAVWEKIIIPEGDLGLSVETVEGEIGKEVSVNINITENPGFGGMSFDVVYDNAVLELVSCENLISFNGTFMPPNLEAADGRAKIQYLSNLENANATGSLVKLTFKILESAPVGFTHISLEPEEDTFFKYVGTTFEMGDLNAVVSNGGVSVKEAEPEYIVGDVDLNGTIDIEDSILLFQHSLLPDLYPVEYPGEMDFTKDGSIDIEDAILLFQHSMLPDLYPLG